MSCELVRWDPPSDRGGSGVPKGYSEQAVILPYREHNERSSSRASKVHEQKDFIIPKRVPDRWDITRTSKA